jgi:hypothetical protein
MKTTWPFRSQFWVVALLCMAIGNGIILWKSRVEMSQGYGDFANFYTAGTLVRRGLGRELYDANVQWKVQQEFASNVKIRRGPMRYIRPPYEALLFVVFAKWPYSQALLYWTLFKLIFYAALPFVVVRGGDWREGFPLWVTVPLILGTFPAFMDLLMGQDAILLAFLFAVCFRQLDTGKDVGAGMTIGLALFKFQLAIPFLIILWIAGRRRVLWGFGVSAALVVLISAAIVGWKGIADYPSQLLAMNETKGVGVFPQVHITVRGLLGTLMHRMPTRGLDLLLALVELGAITFASMMWRRAGGRCFAVGFALAAVVAIVTSAYASDYDLLILVVPLLGMWAGPLDDEKVGKTTHWLETAAMPLLLLTPIYWFTRVQLDAECLMVIPLLAIGVALTCRLWWFCGDESRVTVKLEGTA